MSIPMAAVTSTITTTPAALEEPHPPGIPDPSAGLLLSLNSGDVSGHHATMAVGDLQFGYLA